MNDIAAWIPLLILFAFLWILSIDFDDCTDEGREDD